MMKSCWNMKSKWVKLFSDEKRLSLKKRLRRSLLNFFICGSDEQRSSNSVPQNQAVPSTLVPQVASAKFSTGNVAAHCSTAHNVANNTASSDPVANTKSNIQPAGCSTTGIVHDINNPSCSTTNNPFMIHDSPSSSSESSDFTAFGWIDTMLEKETSKW